MCVKKYVFCIFTRARCSGRHYQSSCVLGTKFYVFGYGILCFRDEIFMFLERNLCFWIRNFMFLGQNLCFWMRNFIFWIRNFSFCRSGEIMLFEVATNISEMQNFVTTSKIQNFDTTSKIQNFVST